MDNEQKKRQEEINLLEPKVLRMIIPQCCREGWATCPHVPKKHKIAKKNIGL